MINLLWAGPSTALIKDLFVDALFQVIFVSLLHMKGTILFKKPARRGRPGLSLSVKTGPSLSANMRMALVLGHHVSLQRTPHLHHGGKEEHKHNNV